MCIGDGSPNDHWRSFSNLRAIVGYDMKRWFTLALSYDVWAQHPDSDGGGAAQERSGAKQEAARSSAGVEEL